MVARKRLTYLTNDGKRHWVKVQKFAMPEGVGFAQAGEESFCHNHTELQQPKDKHQRLAGRVRPSSALPDLAVARRVYITRNPSRIRK